MDVFDELIHLRNLGQKCALATIVQVRGSIPSFESAKLLVREDGSMVGTMLSVQVDRISTPRAASTSLPRRSRPRPSKIRRSTATS